MSTHHKYGKSQAKTGQLVSSKDMDPFPENFLPIFFRNQFRTKIDLPTKTKYSSIAGKVAIITGSNQGLGYEAAKQLLSLGLSRLILAVRSLEKGKAAATKLQTATPNPSAKIEVWQLDMESYPSIQDFARKCEDLDRIDIFIMNAGLGKTDFTTTPSTGHEVCIQVNHLSTALLTVLVLPILKQKGKSMGQPPRLTFVNSVMAHLCKVPNRDNRPFLASFDDTKITPWDATERYGVSKLLNQLFLMKLTEMVPPEDVIINMVDPGLTKGTGLGRDTSGMRYIFGLAFLGIAGRPVERGAATYVDAVLGHGKEAHGCFLMNCNTAP